MAKALVVDDAAFMRMVLRGILQKGGHEVAGEADNGAAAVDQYNALKPDFVTMDITMPNVDGIEAVKRIKAIDPDAAIIMCSAMGQQGMVVQAVQAGARDFVVKPFQEDRVLDSIRKMLGA